MAECNHSWRVDGDDPCVICVHCDRRDDVAESTVTVESVFEMLERIQKRAPIVFCSPAMARKLEEYKGESPPHEVQASEHVADDTVFVWRPYGDEQVIK